MSTSSTLTKTIKCFSADGPKKSLKPFQYESPSVGPHDILIEISHCGICHSDLHLINNDWNITQYPLVPGHEIIGIIKQKGERADGLEVGQRVGVGWQRSSCGHCEWCRQGEQKFCFKAENTCVGHYGGFAEYIVADSRFAFPIPDQLASEDAAPLLCGGATVFAPLLSHKVKATSRVGVIGIGGLGHFALQFAHALGCEVVAFSSSPDKEKEAKEFGADHFISSTDPKAIQKAVSSIDFLLCSSSEHMNWEVFLSTLRPKGNLCLVGAPKEGQINAKILNLILGSKSISGSNISNPQMIRDMLQFAAHHNIVAKTEVFAMSEVNTALNKLASNQIHYRGVLKN
ncbi:MAG: NAD(P)-dependent alcohol dehydrogenase [Chlamydiales bacterium]